MLTITPLDSVSKINYTKQPLKVPQQLPKLGNDSVTFTGAYVKQLKNSKEVQELARIFVDSFIDYTENSTKLGFFEKIARAFSIKTYTLMAKLDSNITEAVKDGDRILGGYSINIAHKTKTAHIGFMTLAKENKNTRVGVETLKTIARRIYDNAVVNNVEKISWSTSKVNKPINRMLSRFDAQVVRKIGRETEYAISTETFGKTLEKLGA